MSRPANDSTVPDPESLSQHASKRMLIVVATICFAVLLLAMPRDLGVYDEGIELSDAMRVLRGDIIHRDFYSLYGPGQFYAVAAALRLPGDHFLAARLYDLSVRAASLTVLFYILFERAGLLTAIMFTAAAGMWMLAIGNYLYPIFPCILLSLLGSYLITRVGKGPMISPPIVGAGFCTGLATLFRYDVGVSLFVAHLFSIVILMAFLPGPEKRDRTFLAPTISYCAGAAAIFLPATIAFLFVAPIEAFLTDFAGYSMKYYMTMRGLPFPRPSSIVTVQGAVYLPFVAILLAWLETTRLIWLRIRFGASLQSDNLTLAYLAVFGMATAALALKGVVRVNPLQMLLAIITSFVVFSVLVKNWWRRGYSARFGAAAVVVLALYPAALAAKHEVGQSVREKDRSIVGWLALRAGVITDPEEERCETGPASGIAKLPPDYAKVSNYLAAHTLKDERIFVALDRHDKIFINPLLLYFTTGRLPGTHWQVFDPGLQTRADIQLAIIDDVQRNSVRWVVRDASFDDINEPNDSSRSSGVNLLDRYLDSNFRQVASAGKVAIWLANRETPSPTHQDELCEATPFLKRPASVDDR